ncbi:MAG TPA: TraB/GumN family protein [Noviherbaspirillum sp.]
MNKIIVLPSVVAGLFVSLFVSFFVPLAYAENNAAPAAAQATSVTHRGTLYRIRHPGGTAWLFGTVHVGTPEFSSLGPEAMQALAASSRIALELDVRDDAAFQSALQKYGLYSGNDGLNAHLSAATLALLRVELNRAGVPYANVGRMKPWLLANLLVALQLERAGYERRNGVETWLAAQAESKPLHELESADYQMSLFDGMSEADQEQYLREQLAELGSGETLRRSRELISAWAAADSKAQERVMTEELSEKTLSADFMRRTLLAKRNPEMATRIEDLLKKEGDAFVAVGLLHLLGENGIPALLQRRGYKVEKVY